MFVEFVSRPLRGRVRFTLAMTFKARIPLTAAIELDRDDIQPRVIVRATRLTIDSASTYLMTVDKRHRARAVNVISLFLGG
jgi:hypothetical protein